LLFFLFNGLPLLKFVAELTLLFNISGSFKFHVLRIVCDD
jgi:hypothetical protein